MGSTGSQPRAVRPRVISVSREIDATPEEIFDVLADPGRHGEIDGSGMVQGVRQSATGSATGSSTGRSTGESNRLRSGSTFGMDMKLGVIPYRITNRVVEFEPNRLIAWQHFGGHRWRYELEPIDTPEGPRTRVTESFDWSTSRAPRLIELAGYPKRHPANMAATLDRLARLVAR